MCLAHFKLNVSDLVRDEWYWFHPVFVLSLNELTRSPRPKTTEMLNHKPTGSVQKPKKKILTVKPADKTEME